jgi:protease-4
MSEQDLAVVTDGRVLTARQALELHMVDQLGYLDDAITEARALAGIEYADVILYRAYPSQNANIYARAAENPALLEQAFKVLLRRQGPMFLYLWSPGL